MKRAGKIEKESDTCVMENMLLMKIAVVAGHDAFGLN